MALMWTDDDADAAREAVQAGEWKDGVFVPAKEWPPRGPRVTMVRDIVRTLLDLRAN